MQGSGLISSLLVQLPGSRGSGVWAARKLLSWPVPFLSDLSCSGCSTSMGSFSCHRLKSLFDVVNVDRAPGRCQALGCVWRGEGTVLARCQDAEGANMPPWISRKSSVSMDLEG